MNITLRRIVGLFMLIGLCVFSLAAFAQDSTLPTIPATNPFQSIFDALAGKYGWVLTLLTIVGILRVAVKPVMLVVEAVVKATPSTADDAALDKFEKGPVLKWLLWGLDWVASVKSPSAPTTNPLVKTTTLLIATLCVASMCIGCSSAKAAKQPASTPVLDAPCQGTSK